MSIAQEFVHTTDGPALSVAGVSPHDSTCGDAGEGRVELDKLWRDLCAGRVKIAHSFCTSERCCLVLERPVNPPARDARLAQRKLDILERILLGQGQKAVAVELGLAPSTVTLIAGECLRAMGLECRTSRVPAILAIAAHAAHGLVEQRHATKREVSVEGRLATSVSVPRPDLPLESWLSGAECRVAQLLVEGHSHAEIAKMRGTSMRTIANQLNAVFRKLGVSGRSELLSHLAQNRGLKPAPARVQPKLSMIVSKAETPHAVVVPVPMTLARLAAASAASAASSA